MRQRCFFIGAGWGDSAVSAHFKALGRELAARGHRVVFLIPGRRLADEAHDANPAVYTWPSRRPTYPRDFYFMVRLARRYHPDCLIANFSAVNAMILAGRAAGVPTRVAWYHTLSDQIDLDSGFSGRKLRFLRWRKRQVYGQATHLVAVSQAAALDLRRVFNAPAEKCAVWPLLLADPQQEINVAGRARHDWQILCVGRLWPTKGQDVLLRALPPLVERFPHLRVDFVGAGPERETYEALAGELGVGEYCRFVGNVPHREVLERMAAAALVVVPSRVEALALVNIESLAMGTPVVATRVGGIGEIIRDGLDGYLVPADDPAALGERIGYLLDHPAERGAMGAAARQGFLARFELGANIGRQVAWYEQLASGLSPGRLTAGRGAKEYGEYECEE
jgi:glycosyltransferase involved in cell wall biosynthesis